jgi:serine/threonine protein kinase
MAEGKLLRKHFFIIMDRLYDTLDKRIKQWNERYSTCKGNFFGFGADKDALYQLTVERLIVAYDLAAALAYIHQNKIIYRDIKQENIGFDVRGDVKIFDFGLAKSVKEELRAKDSMGRLLHGYNLTPRTGSIPYMAPHVAEGKPYDEKCDVFSFAILFWEILSLKKAFKGFSRRTFLVRVVRQKERPVISKRWPLCAPMILQEAWDDDPTKRPSMKRIAALIRGDLNERSHDDAVTNRTSHMRNRSAHSAHLRMFIDNEAE